MLTVNCFVLLWHFSAKKKMNKLIAFVVVCLVAYVSCQAGDHCLDKAFKTHALLLSPGRVCIATTNFPFTKNINLYFKQDLEDFESVYFDATTNKQRIDSFIIEPTFRHLQVFLRHDLKTGYEYNPVDNFCRSFPIYGDLKPFCLVNNATKTRDVTIGATLKCETWEEKVQGYRIRLVLAVRIILLILVVMWFCDADLNFFFFQNTQPGKPHNVPVNVFSHGGRLYNFLRFLLNNFFLLTILLTSVHNTFFQEWFDFTGSDQPLADQSVFNVPAACLRAQKDANYVLPEKLRAMYGFLNPNL